MKKLLELEARLIKAREELEKQSILGSMNPITGMPGDTAGIGASQVNKDEDCPEDEKKDKKMIDEKMDEHNEKKHGEAKDTDSAKKGDYKMEKSQPLIKFHPNGQWSLNKGATMDPKPNGEFDVPVKEVYNGDDAMTHVGSKSVDDDKKGKTEKPQEIESKLIKL